MIERKKRTFNSEAEALAFANELRFSTQAKLIKVKPVSWQVSWQLATPRPVYKKLKARLLR